MKKKPSLFPSEGLNESAGCVFLINVNINFCFSKSALQKCLISTDTSLLHNHNFCTKISVSFRFPQIVFL